MNEILKLIYDINNEYITSDVFDVFKLAFIVENAINKILDSNDDKKYKIDYIFEKVSDELSFYISKVIIRNIVLSKIIEGKQNNLSREDIINGIFEELNYEDEELREWINKLLLLINYDESDLISIVSSLNVIDINEIPINKKFVNFAVEFNHYDVIDILSLENLSLRKFLIKNELFGVSNDWRILFKDTNELIQYILTKIMNIINVFSKNIVSPDNTNDVLELLKSNTLMDLSVFSNNDLLNIFDSLIRSHSNTNSIDEIVRSVDQILEELSRRSLSKRERERLTRLLTNLLRNINSIGKKTFEEEMYNKILLSLLHQNIHNIEIDDELISEISKLSSDIVDSLYYGKAKEVEEEDLTKALQLIIKVHNKKKYEQLIYEYIEKVKELKMSDVKIKIKGHKRIDYRRTIKGIVKYRVPRLNKYDTLKILNNMTIVIDVSGSMSLSDDFYFGSRKRRMEQVQIAILTSYMFVRAMREMGGDYKLYIFAEKLVDLSSVSPEVIISLIDNIDKLREHVGGGTELMGTLMTISKKMSSEDTLILFSDTGDLSVSPDLLRPIINRIKSFIVLSPSNVYDNTKVVFDELNIPVYVYKSMDDIFKYLKSLIKID